MRDTGQVSQPLQAGIVDLVLRWKSLLNYRFSTKANDVVKFLKPQFVGRPKHTGYPNLPMVVLWQLAFSGRRDGGVRTQRIILQLTQTQRNFTLMEKQENRKLKDRSVLRHLRLTMITDSTGHLVSSDKVQGSFISHYLHKINIERKVQLQHMHDYKIK